MALGCRPDQPVARMQLQPVSYLLLQHCYIVFAHSQSVTVFTIQFLEVLTSRSHCSDFQLARLQRYR